MSKEVKNREASISQFLRELNYLISQIIESGEGGKRTMDQDEFKFYLNKYLKLFTECGFLVDDHDNKKELKEYARNEYLSVTRKIHEELVYHLNRILYPHTNMSVHASSLEDLQDAILKVEENFSEEVHSARKFFGDFLDFMDEKLWKNSSPFFSGEPQTIGEMLDCPKRFDWLHHTISNGYPQPCYLEAYRVALKRITEKYIAEQEKAWFCYAAQA